MDELHIGEIMEFAGLWGPCNLLGHALLQKLRGPSLSTFAIS
jgi:hypothetical protein